MRLLTASLFLTACIAGILASSRPAASTTPTQLSGGIVVPYYGAAYGGSDGISQADAKRMLELLAQIERNTRPREGLAQPAAKLDQLAVAKTKCIACHTPARADAKGGGFILFGDEEGKAFVPLSGRARTRIKEAVLSGVMPPSGKLSAAEKAAFE